MADSLSRSAVAEALGGVGLFLVGMSPLTDGIRRIAGEVHGKFKLVFRQCPITVVDSMGPRIGAVGWRTWG